jgi:hypothetical protein
VGHIVVDRQRLNTMQNNTFYPLAMLSIIGIAFYFLYSEYLSPKNVDMNKYKEVCEAYQNAPPGTYTDAQLLSLVNKVNYLLPGEVNDLTVPIEREVKACATQLSKRLSH